MSDRRSEPRRVCFLCQDCEDEAQQNGDEKDEEEDEEEKKDEEEEEEEGQEKTTTKKVSVSVSRFMLHPSPCY